MLQYFRGRTAFLDASVMQHRHTVGDMLHHAKIVRDHDQRHARVCRADGAECLQNPHACGHVDGAHRLVGKNDARIVHYGTRDGHTLRLPAGKIHGVPCGEHRRVKPDHTQCMLGLRGDLIIAHALVVQAQRLLYGTCDAPARVERGEGVLEHQAGLSA